MSYTSITGTVHADYVFGRDGDYHLAGTVRKGTSTSERVIRRAVREGDVCEGCWQQRSAAGRCECNS